MSRDTEALLDAFEHLPVEERRAFTQEVLRRSRPFDSGPLEDEEIGAASALAQPIRTRQVAHAGEFLFVVGHDRTTQRQGVSRDQHVISAKGRAHLLQTGA